MKKQPKPTKHSISVLHQLCNYIPTHMVAKLARRHGIDQCSRTFTAWSHVICLLFAQLTHSISLNDVCDALCHHAAKLGAIRGAKAPARNTLSHANKRRGPDMMEDLFWEMVAHLHKTAPRFAGSGRKFSSLPRRFKRAIHAVDSTTIALVANCMDWAKHRRRKAAAKLHLRLNLQSFLPGFAVIEEASHHDSVRTMALCHGLQEGEIVVFDKAYVDFDNLQQLSNKGVFWVTRAKDNMSVRVCRKRIRQRQGDITGDDEVVLKDPATRSKYPKRFRRITAWVEVDGKPMLMTFISNNMQWAPTSICDLYQCRWSIEVFFKQIKQTLKLCDFLGHSKNAIRWQIWAALLLYLLLRFQAFLSQWPHSFTRLFALIRGIVWDRFELPDILDFYGTARTRWRMRSAPETLYLPGFSP